MTTFICIGGKARAGKDTSAKFFEEELKSRGFKVIITHYADLLKYICEKFFGWDGIKDEAGRSLLQKVGTNLVREREPDFWVNFIIHIANLFPEQWDYIIVPDTRFPNEIYKIDEAGYPHKYIRIERPGIDNGLTEEQKNHPSETALDDVRPDFLVYNTDLEKFKNDIAKICDLI